jgi:ATP-binding cassette subfamily B protein
VAVSFVPFIAIYMIIREIASNPAALGNENSAVLIRYGWIAAGGAAAAIFLNFIALLLSHIAAFSTLYKLKLDFANHIASLSLGFHTQNPTGKLRKITDENIEKLELFIAHQLPDLAGTLAMPIFTLAILIFFDWKLGLASIFPIALAYFIQMNAFGGKTAKHALMEYQDSLEDMNNSAVEYVRGISIVKAYNQTIFSFKKFHDSIINYGNFVKEYTMSLENSMALFVVIINHVYLFILPVIILLSSGVTDYGEFAISAIFYLLFSLSIPTSFIKLLYVTQSGQQIADGVMRMDRILDIEPLPVREDPKEAKNHTVAFENVSFSYDQFEDPLDEESFSRNDVKIYDGMYDRTEDPLDSSDLAIRDVSFTAKQGEITALVGPSGGGKSTIAHLIPRFYDVKAGRVTIGGVDVRDMSPDYLMSIVGFVFQDIFLFKKSIKENIRAGNKTATDEQVINAAKLAQCDEFVRNLPEGYDTVIGRENVHLSGGQRQRLVIARAILKDSPILILDEATSYSDVENERKIQMALEELIKDKTVIIIAHRLSTVKNANKIVALDKGVKVEEGTHAELIEKNGLYSRMWESFAQNKVVSIRKKGKDQDAPNVETIKENQVDGKENYPDKGNETEEVKNDPEN